MNKLKKAKIAVASFVLVLVVCMGVFPFAGATYTERDKIIDIALNEVGYTQQNGYNKYSAEFGTPYTAWCNYFVVWCAKQAGVSPEAVTGNNSYGGNCTLYMQGLKNHGRFFENDGSYTPKKGDLVFYNSTKSTSASNHIGFVLSADANTVTTVEGNVSVNGTRGVAQNVRSRYDYVGDMIIIGFGVPAYSGEEVPKAQTKKTVEKTELDAEKFETCASVEERVKLGETIKTVQKTEETDLISVLNLTEPKKKEDNCLGVFCICDEMYNNKTVSF